MLICNISWIWKRLSNRRLSLFMCDLQNEDRQTSAFIHKFEDIKKENCIFKSTAQKKTTETTSAALLIFTHPT